MIAVIQPQTPSGMLLNNSNKRERNVSFDSLNANGRSHISLLHLPRTIDFSVDSIEIVVLLQVNVPNQCKGTQDTNTNPGR